MGAFQFFAKDVDIPNGSGNNYTRSKQRLVNPSVVEGWTFYAVINSTIRRNLTRLNYQICFLTDILKCTYVDYEVLFSMDCIILAADSIASIFHTLTKDQFFKRYEIDIREGRLGGGAFGTVYRAYDHVTDQEKAIKVAEVKYINGKEFSLQAEFDATSNLPVHKNIANYEAVYQFQMPNGLFDYAVMQYYPDGNLKELLANHSLDEQTKCEIVDGIFSGVGYLHDHKIIHRDIKPSNILISERNGRYTPKIADFGLSKLVSSEDMEAITNSFGGGTLEYSSPEQLLGKELRLNTDLWSAGVIAYEIFLGNIPFVSNDLTGSADAKRRIIYQNIVNAPIPAEISKCPSPYDRIIRACLQKDPNKRISGNEELIKIRENREYTAIEAVDDETLILSEEEKAELVAKRPIKHEPEGSASDSKNDGKSETKKRLLIGLIALFAVFVSFILYKKITEDTGGINENDAVEIENELVADEMKVIESQREIRQRQEDKIWEFTKRDGSLEAYEEYKALYPKGRYIRQVDSLITIQLESIQSKNEASAFNMAKSSKSISAYRAFVDAFPESDKRLEAEREMAELEQKAEMDYWNSIKTQNTIEGYQEFLKIYPESKYADVANKSIQTLFKERLELRAYNRALKLNTVEGYEAFLNAYGSSKYASKVKQKRQALFQTSEVKPKNQNKPITYNTKPTDLIPEQTESDQQSGDSFDDSVEPINSHNADSETTNPIVEKVESQPVEEEVNVSEKVNETNDESNTAAKKDKKAEVPPMVTALESEMVTLEEVGSFRLGCDKGCSDDAMPSKTVQLAAFRMHKFEVTQEEWKSIMGSNPSYFDECKECPVENVTFGMAQEFIAKLNALPGNPFRYRLPTEAEWEYAASAGTNFKFSGSNDVEGVANYRSTGNNGTVRGGTQKSNRYGLYDMSGNVAEWCDAWYNEEGFDPPAKKEMRVVRGGHWRSKPSSCEVKQRDKEYPNEQKSTIGFRLVRSL